MKEYRVMVYSDRTECYNLDGEYDSYLDEPTIVWFSGNKYWYKNGKLDRKIGPAIITESSECWYTENKLNRLDGPAIIYTNGSKQYYIEGVNYTKEEYNKIIENYTINETDKTGGVDSVKYFLDKTEKYDSHGELHCLNGPAVIKKNGNDIWYKHGLIHRDGDFPAIKVGNRLCYYKEGLRHRDNGPAIIDYICAWYKHGVLHRVGSPALIIDGQVDIGRWYLNGLLDRIDGPAKTDMYGTEYWYRKGLLHNTTGPAVITNENAYYDNEYYIEGVKYTKEEYNKLTEKFVLKYSYKKSTPITYYTKEKYTKEKFNNINFNKINHNKKWFSGDEFVLRYFYKISTAKECAMILGRSYNSIRSKLKELNIKK